MLSFNHAKFWNDGPWSLKMIEIRLTGLDDSEELGKIGECLSGHKNGEHKQDS